jgi:hypothetical protein
LWRGDPHQPPKQAEKHGGIFLVQLLVFPDLLEQEGGPSGRKTTQVAHITPGGNEGFLIVLQFFRDIKIDCNLK